jgi:catechol 2,3-dioxygenase-like lactoylglutathione lyase family enzyme
MEKPKIRHIAINSKDAEKVVAYYKKVFGMEEKFRDARGGVFLSDGYIALTVFSTTRCPYGINHFGFQVPSIEAIEKISEGTAKVEPPEPGIVADCWLPDIEGNRVDLSEEGWPT